MMRTTDVQDRAVDCTADGTRMTGRLLLPGGTGKRPNGSPRMSLAQNTHSGHRQSGHSTAEPPIRTADISPAQDALPGGQPSPDLIACHRSQSHEA
jgi:hypothetical protein